MSNLVSKFNLILFLFGAIVYGLNSSKNNKINYTDLVAINAATDNSKNEGKIYIKFIDKPVFNNSLKTKTSEIGRIEYLVFYDDMESEKISFQDIVDKKAATYSTNSNQVMVRRYLSFFEFQDFLVHQGDSLIMSFDRNKPVVIKHSNYSYALQDFNIDNSLDNKFAESYSTTGMADDTRQVAFKFFYDNPSERENQRARKGYEKGFYIENLENKMGKMLIPKMEILNNQAQQFLDSLYKAKLISNDVYAFHQQKYSNLLLKLKMMSGSIDSTIALNEINERFKKQNFHSEYLNECLNNFEKTYFTSKAKWISSNNFNLRDPKESFTFVKNSPLLSQEIKEKMLFISLNKIDWFFHEEVDKYLKSFTEIVTDKTLLEKAQAKFQKDTLVIKNLSNLHLLTLDKKQTTIEEILQKKKGKVLFIDFWASWCGPCIEEMKFSKNLLQTYKDKDIEILYFSMDDNYQKWQKASEHLNINNIDNSLKIINNENSKFLQEQKITTIPRYIIINKEGKVINSDAPRPSDPKIRKIFDELLKK